MPGRIQIGLGPKLRGQRHLVFLGQNGDLGYAVNIRVEAPDRPREYQAAVFSD
jgi:hypothetical protein